MLNVGTWVSSGGIQVLGAPLGPADFCSDRTRTRRNKARPPLCAINEFGHTQGALLLLPTSASFAQVSLAMRAVPPALQNAPLTYFVADMRGVLEGSVGGPVPERSGWLAQPSLQHRAWA